MRKVGTVFLLAGVLWAVPAEKGKVVAGEPSLNTREVTYSGSDVEPISVQVGYSTMLVFPETVVLAACGDTDRDRWLVEHAGPIVLIQSGKQGRKTNLNIVLASGKSETFWLREISFEADAHADLHVTIKAAGDPHPPEGKKDGPLFFTAAEIESLKQQRDAAVKAAGESDAKRLEAAQTAKAEAQTAVESSIKHDYTWRHNKQSEDLGLKEIYNLNGFTYVEGQWQEAPAIYELKSGKDSLIEATLNPDGTYVIPKILKHGYLRIGKTKVEFEQEGKS